MEGMATRQSSRWSGTTAMPGSPRSTRGRARFRVSLSPPACCSVKDVMTLSVNPVRRFLMLAVCLEALAACGGSTPPPRTEDTAKTDSSTQPVARPTGPSVEQELGSIDERAVAKTFDKLQIKLET